MEDLKLLEHMAAHSRELMVAVLHMLVTLNKGEAGSESCRCLGRVYTIQSLPSKNAVTIQPTGE